MKYDYDDSVFEIDDRQLDNQMARQIDSYLELLDTLNMIMIKPHRIT